MGMMNYGNWQFTWTGAFPSNLCHVNEYLFYRYFFHCQKGEKKKTLEDIRKGD